MLFVTVRYLAKFNHVQLAIFHIGVVFAYQFADLVSRKLDVNNFQCLLQLQHRDEAIPISINLTQTQAFQHCTECIVIVLALDGNELQ